MTQRKDTWNEEEDKILADLVLSSIRTGGTQLKAFELAGAKLNRTAAACGFRWNGKVRQRYKREIELAREERKTPTSLQRKRKNERSDVLNEVDPDEFKNTLDRIIEEYKKAKTENERFCVELKELKQKYDELEAEYQNFLRVISKVYKNPLPQPEQKEIQERLK